MAYDTLAEAKQYDLIVIGGGPAGIIGAATAAALGRTVALVDSHADLGGAGANTGTVPSKTLRETALGAVWQALSRSLRRGSFPAAGGDRSGFPPARTKREGRPQRAPRPAA